MKNNLLKKMLRSLFTVHCLFFGFGACADTPVTRPSMVSVFSTSSDWEAVTGLRLTEYHITVSGASIGTELYYLDGFPCYAQSEQVRTWVDRREKGRFLLVCLYQPTVVQLAWREAGKEDYQNVTRGIMECPISRK